VRCAGGLAVLIWAACLSLALAGNWPQWRGPEGTGTSREQGLPLVWNESRNLLWKVPIPEWGNSTPAVWQDAVFLTAQQGRQLLLLRYSKQDGSLVWRQRVGTAKVPRGKPRRGAQTFHELHNLASPSPVTDGERVIVHFGNGELAAYDMQGAELWRHNLQQEHGPFTIWWGHAASPVIVGNVVIVAVMQDSLADLPEHAQRPAPSYLVAYDKRHGRQKWKTLRMTAAQAEECDAYTTPLLCRGADRWELVVMGANQLDAYDPATGEQLWYLPGLRGGRTVCGPTFADGMIYATRGMRGDLFGVSLGSEQKGERSPREIAWSQSDATPDSCSPVVWGDLIFTITDQGVAKCYDRHSGRMRWKQRLAGEFKASPLAAEGRVYFLSTAGDCYVVAADDKYRLLAKSQLDDTFVASLAASDGLLLARGRKHLYCLGKR